LLGIKKNGILEDSTTQHSTAYNIQQHSHDTARGNKINMAPVIGILGATGKTGLSIVNGLLAIPSDIPSSNIISLTRPNSVTNSANTKLATSGVSIRAFNLDSPHATLVSSLSDIDVIISCVSGPEQLLQQIPLADAAKEAGVKRFIPSAWLPIIPPGGVHFFRDLKEQVYTHIKSISLPYTIVDVGWWYQFAYPKLPSGKVDYSLSFPAEEIYGTGEPLSALTDLKDVGRYVARIVFDDRTVNKYVLCYNEMHSQLDSWALMERLSGETIPRIHVPREELEADIAEALPLLMSGKVDHRTPEGLIVALQAVGRQYALSWGVRGDNTPEVAKELGYVTSKELWPEMEFGGFEEFLKNTIEGRGAAVYDQRDGLMQVVEMLRQRKAAAKGLE
jgi:hypothetical protein